MTNLISLYLCPDKTQLVKGHYKKNTLDIDLAMELPSYWDALTGGIYKTPLPGQSLMETMNSKALNALFEGVRKVTKAGYEEIRIVIPDLLFTMVSAFPFVSESLLQTQIDDALDGNADEYYIIQPLEVKAPYQPHRTVYAIKKKYIDRLVSAAKEENITLTVVEPASFAFVRGRMEWTHDYPFMEMFPAESAMLSFSPIGGIFRTDALGMGIDELCQNDVTVANQKFTSLFATTNYNAGKAFGVMTPDAKYTFLTDSPKIPMIAAVEHNMEKEPLLFPSFVHADIPARQQKDWLIAVSPLMADYPDLMVLYPRKRQSIVVKSANLLPEEFRLAARNKQWTKNIQHLLKVGLTIGIILLLAEIGTAFYFGSIEVSPSVKQDYEQSQKDNASVNKELLAIKDAKTSGVDFLRVYGGLMRSRPSSMAFTSLAIGNKNGAKKGDGRFVEIRAMAGNQMLFNDFISNLSMEDTLFRDPIVNNITSDKGKGLFQADIGMNKAENKGGDAK